MSLAPANTLNSSSSAAACPKRVKRLAGGQGVKKGWNIVIMETLCDSHGQSNPVLLGSSDDVNTWLLFLFTVNCIENGAHQLLLFAWA